MSGDIERFAAPSLPGYPAVPLSDSVRAGNTLYVSAAVLNADESHSKVGG